MTRTLYTVELRGSPYARGCAHGESLREPIHAALARWQEHLARATNTNVDDYLLKFLAYADFRPAIEVWSPDLWREVEGIADGANVDRDTMYVYQLMDEEWLFQRFHYRAPMPTHAEHCSSMAAFGRVGQPTLLAQNMDLPAFMDGGQTLLKIEYPNSDLRVTVFTGAGLLGLNGLNNSSVGVCVNTLWKLDHSPRGLPVAFVIRRLLEQVSHADAVNFLTSVPHASGQNYMVADPTGASDWEGSASGVAQFEPQAGAQYLYHTNHPFVNEHQGMYETAFESLPAPAQSGLESSAQNSRARAEVLHERVTQELTGEDAQAILSLTEPAPICVNRPGSLTFGSVVMELGEDPKLSLAPGPPNEERYQEFRF